MKRLLWINHFAVVPGEGGGTRHFEMSRELVRRGWDVTVAASDVHLQSRTYTRRDGAERPPGDPRGPRRRPVPLSLVGALRAQRLAARLELALVRPRALRWTPDAGRPDVVIGSSPHLFAALAGWRLATRWGVPFVFEVRDLWPESMTAAGRLEGARVRGLRPDRAVALRPRRPDRVPRAAARIDFLARERGVPAGAARVRAQRRRSRARSRTSSGPTTVPSRWSTPARTARPTVSTWSSTRPSSSATATTIRIRAGGRWPDQGRPPCRCRTTRA